MTNKALAALMALVQTLTDGVLAFFTGVLTQENRKLNDELARNTDADRAVVDNRARSFDERVRKLKRRGRVRDV